MKKAMKEFLEDVKGVLFDPYYKAGAHYSDTDDGLDQVTHGLIALVVYSLGIAGMVWFLN